MVRQLVLSPAMGLSPDPAIVSASRKTLRQSLQVMEDTWLHPFLGSGHSVSHAAAASPSAIEESALFLGGHGAPTIADLSMACEVMQLQVSGIAASTLQPWKEW